MPKKELAISDIIYAFQEHIFFRVYRNEKPYTYEIKISQLCEAKNGMYTTLKFMVAHAIY